mmetsp:Transcript_45304/g.117240  ORF Transcript_45304/g.117240 Transcript_45304/m.117240 type:complete len:806 (-) Transcript_45304:7-2424(-)
MEKKRDFNRLLALLLAFFLCTSFLTCVDAKKRRGDGIRKKGGDNIFSSSTRRRGHEGKGVQLDPRCRLPPHLSQSGPRAFIDRALTLQQEGKEETEFCYRNALAFGPVVGAYNNLGIFYAERGRVHDAVELYREGIRHYPTVYELHVNLGNQLRRLGRVEEAEAEIAKAIPHNPSHLTLFNYATVLMDLNRYGEASFYFGQAHQQKPDWHLALFEQGRSLRLGGQHNHTQLMLAASTFTRAIQMAMSTSPSPPPSNATIGNYYYERGCAYGDDEQYMQAVADYTSAVKFDPFHADAFYSKCHYALFLCWWDEYEDIMSHLHVILRKELDEGKVDPTRGTRIRPHQALLWLEGKELFNVIKSYAREAQYKAGRFSTVPSTFAPAQVPPRSRLRIGYVASGLSKHPDGKNTQGVYKRHDRKKVEVFCFSTWPGDGSQEREEIRSGCEHFEDIHALSTQGMADAINEKSVQVLIDVNGYTGQFRAELFALRLAPIQVNFLGWVATSGAPYIDYQITDNIASPPEYTSFYTEHFTYMPYSYFVSNLRQSEAGLKERGWPITRKEVGLPEKGQLVANFNSLYKVDSDVLSIWAKVLSQVPNSTFWMQRLPGAAEEHLRNEFEKKGVDSRRLIFTDLFDASVHLKAKAMADLSLDTFVYNAHTSGVDVLWAGVPLLSRPGTRMSNRVAAGLLRALGLQDLICQDSAAYEKKAVELLTHPARLADVRTRLWQARLTSPLFDTSRWVRDFEKAVRMQWEVKVALPSRRLSSSHLSSSCRLISSRPCQLRVDAESGERGFGYHEKAFHIILTEN